MFKWFRDIPEKCKKENLKRKTRLTLFWILATIIFGGLVLFQNGMTSKGFLTLASSLCFASAGASFVRDEKTHFWGIVIALSGLGVNWLIKNGYVQDWGLVVLAFGVIAGAYVASQIRLIARDDWKPAEVPSKVDDIDLSGQVPCRHPSCFVKAYSSKSTTSVEKSETQKE